jgi:hypothetical protein
VVVGVAEHDLGRFGAFVIKLQVVFPGESDAAALTCFCDKCPPLRFSIASALARNAQGSRKARVCDPSLVRLITAKLDARRTAGEDR